MPKSFNQQLDALGHWLIKRAAENHNETTTCSMLRRKVDAILRRTPPPMSIEDGFGNAWSIICPQCGQPTMQVVRPGKVQCSNCG